MPRPSKPLIVALAATGVALIVPALWVLRAGGLFSPISGDHAGGCRVVAVAGGIGDIQLDRERGLAYLSVQGTGNGTVMLLDLNLADPAPRAAMSHDPPAYRPGAISLLATAGQPARLFAVSLPGGGPPVVEISVRDTNGAFVPRATVRDPALDNATRVAAAGPERFYVVDHRPPRGALGRMLALLGESGRDSLALYDAGRVRVLARDLAWVSGLALSADGTHLYVAELLARRLRIYRVAADDLVLERTVALKTPPGGVNVAADGAIWLTGHPRLLRYFAALDGARAATPTQIIRFDPRLPDARAMQVFADDGTMLSAGSAVAPWRDEFLIGGPLEKKVLICKAHP